MTPVHLKINESENKSFDMKPRLIYKHQLIHCEFEFLLSLIKIELLYIHTWPVFLVENGGIRKTN